MLKWVLLVLVVALVLWWTTRGRSGRSGGEGSGASAGGSRAAEGGQAPGQAARKPEPMLRCAHCGLMLPRSDSVVDTATQQAYCSGAHRDAGPSSPP